VRYRLAAIDAWILDQEIEPSEGMTDPDDAGERLDLEADIVDLDNYVPNGGAARSSHLYLIRHDASKGTFSCLGECQQRAI